MPNDYKHKSIVTLTPEELADRLSVSSVAKVVGAEYDSIRDVHKIVLEEKSHKATRLFDKVYAGSVPPEVEVTPYVEFIAKVAFNAVWAIANDDSLIVRKNGGRYDALKDIEREFIIEITNACIASNLCDEDLYQFVTSRLQLRGWKQSSTTIVAIKKHRYLGEEFYKTSEAIKKEFALFVEMIKTLKRGVSFNVLHTL